MNCTKSETVNSKLVGGQTRMVEIPRSSTNVNTLITTTNNNSNHPASMTSNAAQMALF